MNKKLTLNRIRIFTEPDIGLNWIEDIRNQNEIFRGMMISGGVIWINGKQEVLFPVIVRENLDAPACFKRYHNLLDWLEECNQLVRNFIDQYDPQCGFDIILISEWVMILKVNKKLNRVDWKEVLDSASTLNANLAKTMSREWGGMPTVPCQPDSKHRANSWLRLGVR